MVSATPRRCRWAVVSLAIAAVVAAAPVHAEWVNLLKDIAPGYADSLPYGFTAVNGNLMFMTCEGCEWGGPMGGVHRLWKSNGTLPGTVPLKTFAGWPQLDIFFPPDSMDPDDYYMLGQVLKYLMPFREMVNVNGMFYFPANDGVHGVELWKSDGTAAGTLMVKDLSPGILPSMPISMAKFNDALYFSACQLDEEMGEPQCGLWRSYGTELTTTLIRPFFLPPISLQVVGTNLYFGGCGEYPTPDPEDYDEACGLWLSNGTPEGTLPVYSVDPDYGFPLPPLFPTTMNGMLYFSACWPHSFLEDSGTCAVWQSNGTAMGTHPVMPSSPYGPAFSYPPTFLTPLDGRLYFNACDSYDTTPAPCYLYEFDPAIPWGWNTIWPAWYGDWPPEDGYGMGFLSPFVFGPSWMTAFGGDLFFGGCSWDGGLYDCGLWQVPFSKGYYDAYPIDYKWPSGYELPFWPAYQLTPLNGRIYFGAGSGYLLKQPLLADGDEYVGVEPHYYGPPNIYTNPTPTLTFAKIYVGYQTTKRLTIGNNGKGPMEFWVETDGLAAPFTITKNTCNALYDPEEDALVLQQGKTCYLDLAFKPTARGTFKQYLTIWNNDPDYYNPWNEPGLLQVLIKGVTY